jgi:hypothetical protein
MVKTRKKRSMKAEPGDSTLTLAVTGRRSGGTRRNKR